MATEIRPRLITNSRWLRLMPAHIGAITVGRTIYARGATLTLAQLRHEATHVRQFAERGLWRGLAEYVLLYCLYGYARHPWELEARRAEGDVNAYVTG